LQFHLYYAANMRSCPLQLWERIHESFTSLHCKRRKSVPCIMEETCAFLDTTHVWAHFLTLLDENSLATLAVVSRGFVHHWLGRNTAELLRTRLGTPRLKGSVPAIFGLGRLLRTVGCCFLRGDDLSSGWDGEVSAVHANIVRQVRLRFPEAQCLLWQTAFSEIALKKLSEPLAVVDAEPAATVRIGTVALTLTLQLTCVSAKFFDAASPQRKLLARLKMEVDNRGVFWPGGAPGPDGQQLCGEGHRWACVCQTAEEHSAVPLFCSLKESYLRPAWRNPRVLLNLTRPHLHGCESLDGETLGKALTQPQRLILSIYRCDDDEGPDDPR